MSPEVSTCSTHIWVLAQASLWYPAPPPLSLPLLLSPSIYQCSCSRFSPPLSFLAQNLDRILDSRQNLATPSEVWRWRLLISAGRSLATPQYTQPLLMVRDSHQWSHALHQECADKRDAFLAISSVHTCETVTTLSQVDRVCWYQSYVYDAVLGLYRFSNPHPPPPPPLWKYKEKQFFSISNNKSVSRRSDTGINQGNFILLRELPSNPGIPLSSI